MKSYFSIKPGATFFLGSSRTLVYHKDDVEIIYNVHVNMSVEAFLTRLVTVKNLNAIFMIDESLGAT